MVNTYVAPGIFCEHERPKLKPLPSSTLGVDLGSRPQSGEASLIPGLLQRIHDLECKERANAVRIDGTTLPPGASAGVVTGQFIKSKFYGQSHWMNAIEPVSTLACFASSCFQSMLFCWCALTLASMMLWVIETRSSTSTPTGKRSTRRRSYM